MMAFDLDGYVPVSERIAKWYELHPEGRIVADPPEVHEIGGRFFVGSTARAYRSPDDPCPCQGSAWEPYPGPTQFTKDSEAQNAETSAVGRALALAGVEVHRGMASREEVRARQADPPVPTISAAQAKELTDRLAALPDGDLKDWARELVKSGTYLPRLPVSLYADALLFVEACEAGTPEGQAF